MMRMSCNGCRVLRKGCSRDCSLRPCLEWIQSPESQANATLFLAKFYGRAGLINLINSGPVHLRPAIFRSLLYEACGRISNPIYGSVGLMMAGNWQRCQTAVEAVLTGAPLMQGGDIRHLSKNSTISTTTTTAEVLHRFRTRKRSTARKINNPLQKVAAAVELVKGSTEKFTITGWDYGGGEYNKGFVDHQQDSQSVETVEPALLKQGKTEPRDEDFGLELTLGFNPVRRNLLRTVIELSDES